MAEPDCSSAGIIAGSIPSQTIDSDERRRLMDINPRLQATLSCAAGSLRRSARIEDEDLTAPVLAARRLARRHEDVLATTGSLINSCGAAAWQTVSTSYPRRAPIRDDPLKLPWIARPGLRRDCGVAAKLRETMMRGCDERTRGATV